MGMSQDNTAAGEKLDLGRAATEGWTVRPFPAGVPRPADAVPVVIRRSVLEAILAHGQSHIEVEVCGVLVGDGYRDEHGPFVYVEAIIEGTYAAGQVAEVTFTSDTWAHINEVMDSRYPDRRIIGWYHTHPGFGIFLSPQDLFIHHSFFSAPEQLALVYDPLNGTSGLFVWQTGAAVIALFQIEEDTGPPAPVSAEGRQPPADPLATATTQPVPEPRTRRWPWVVLLLLLLLLAIGVAVVCWKVLGERLGIGASRRASGEPAVIACGEGPWCVGTGLRSMRWQRPA
jgi:proteasome lid subunit RPN8/RPN11